MRTDYGSRTLFLVYLLLSAVIVGSVGYFLVRGPPTLDEGGALMIAQRHVNLSADAIYRGMRLFNASGEELYVVSWKGNSSLVEVQMNSRGRVMDIIDYRFSPEEFNISISRMLAQKIAEGLLKSETKYSTNQELKGPEIFYVGGVGGDAGY
jgi:hypothetical protein